MADVRGLAIDLNNDRKSPAAAYVLVDDLLSIAEAKQLREK